MSATSYNWGAMRQNPLSYSDDEMKSPGVVYKSGFTPANNSVANTGLDLESIVPQRKRTSTGAMLLMNGIDLLGISAGNPNAHIGSTYETKVKFDKLRAEEDPEGYAADLNRAKLLSRKAMQTNDPALKQQYGRAIKALFPQQTQGLDDQTASELFAADSDKLQLEMLKGENAIRKQLLANEGKLGNTALQNEGKRDIANLNNATKEQIAGINNDVRLQIAQLQDEGRRAIAEGNNERAREIAANLNDLKRELAYINGDYKLAGIDAQNTGKMDIEELRGINAYDREAMKQEAANARNAATIAGAERRVAMGGRNAQDLEILRQAGRMEVQNARGATQLKAAAMRPMKGINGQSYNGYMPLSSEGKKQLDADNYARANWNYSEKSFNNMITDLDEAIKLLEQNPGATGIMAGDNGTFMSAKERDAYGKINSIMTNAIPAHIAKLKAAGLGAKGMDSDAERKMNFPAAFNNVQAKARIASIKKLKQQLIEDRAIQKERLFDIPAARDSIPNNNNSSTTQKSNLLNPDGGMTL